MRTSGAKQNSWAGKAWKALEPFRVRISDGVKDGAVYVRFDLRACWSFSGMEGCGMWCVFEGWFRSKSQSGDQSAGPILSKNRLQKGFVAGVVRGN